MLRQSNRIGTLSGDHHSRFFGSRATELGPDLWLCISRHATGCLNGKGSPHVGKYAIPEPRNRLRQVIENHGPGVHPRNQGCHLGKLARGNGHIAHWNSS